MRTIALADAREERLRRRTKGTEGGETKRDEVKTKYVFYTFLIGQSDK